MTDRPAWLAAILLTGALTTLPLAGMWMVRDSGKKPQREPLPDRDWDWKQIAEDYRKQNNQGWRGR